MDDSDNDSEALTQNDRGVIANGLRLGGNLSFALLVTGLFLRVEGHIASNSRLGNALLHVGLVALLATPVVRILTTMWLYRQAGNRRFAAYCMVSLIVVAVSTAVGVLMRR